MHWRKLRRIPESSSFAGVPGQVTGDLDYSFLVVHLLAAWHDRWVVISWHEAVRCLRGWSLKRIVSRIGVLIGPETYRLPLPEVRAPTSMSVGPNVRSSAMKIKYLQDIYLRIHVSDRTTRTGKRKNSRTTQDDSHLARKITITLLKRSKRHKCLANMITDFEL